MRTIMLAAALLALPVPASALCRCTCVRGEMKAICQETDLTIPICQGLCETTIRPDRVIIPLAGARQAFEPAQSTNPAPAASCRPISAWTPIRTAPSWERRASSPEASGRACPPAADAEPRKSPARRVPAGLKVEDARCVTSGDWF